MYYILSGNSGATYIVNVANISNVISSLQFYQTINFKLKLNKVFLILFFTLLSHLTHIIKFKSIKSSDEINEYLKLLGLEVEYGITDDCSVLVSSTKDKVIVHHHGICYHKFAFGKSYKSVKNESGIYNLLRGKLSFISISDFYDLKDEADIYCSFKMITPNKLNKVITNTDSLCDPLVELFEVSKGGQTTVFDVLAYLESSILGVETQVSPLPSFRLEDVVQRLRLLPDQIIPTGFVHGDFKSWNMISSDPLIVFDFEESGTNGLPLEDYLNYLVDPIVRFKDADEVANLIFNEANLIKYEAYLQRIGCDVNFKVMLYLYLVGRIVAWSQKGQHGTAVSYTKLLSTIDNSQRRLDV